MKRSLSRKKKVDEEVAEINRGIQAFQEARQMYQKLLHDLPTYFRSVKAARKSMRADFDMWTHRFKTQQIKEWQLPFEVAIFRSPKLRKTKANLRREFRNEPRDVRIINGEFKYPISMQIYRNPIIQNLFEFSLKYSYLTKKEFTVEQAKKLYIQYSMVSLGLESRPKVADRMKQFVMFMGGEKSVINPLDLSIGEVGRPRGETEETKQIERLSRSNFNAREIVNILHPHRSPQDKKQLAETVKKTLQRLKRKKGT